MCFVHLPIISLLVFRSPLLLLETHILVCLKTRCQLNNIVRFLGEQKTDKENWKAFSMMFNMVLSISMIDSDIMYVEMFSIFINCADRGQRLNRC